MSRLTTTDAVDLDIFYTADSFRYTGERKKLLDLVTKEVFIGFYKNCASRGFQFDGQPIGGIIFDGTEAHIAILPEYHGRWAILLKPALKWLFTLKPEIFVEIDIDNEKCLAFMDRNGWQRMRVNATSITYRMTLQTSTQKIDKKVAALAAINAPGPLAVPRSQPPVQSMQSAGSFP
ncbi:MAG: GNAT family N-acetyltransferase [Pseudomonadota bacterium]